LLAQTLHQLVNQILAAGGADEDALVVVANPAAQAEFTRGAVHEGPKTHALHDPADA
jgi:hypothetical protein